MRIVIFFILLILFIFLIPNDFIVNFVSKNITISGDGEEAMNNFETAVILIEVTLSAVMSLLLMWVFRKVIKKQ